MTWCYPDEHSDYAYLVLDALEHTTAVVPSLWHLEIANSLIVGERRQRLSAVDVDRFFELLNGLNISVDMQTASHALSETLLLARTHRLSSYDAAYLELAAREGLVMATLDEKLRKAAESIGVPVVK
jgi:predicted nucleic acid-binding protein